MTRRTLNLSLDHLRRSLPAAAHARQPLLSFLFAKRVIGSTAPTLRVVNVFPSDAGGNLMCQFKIDGDHTARTFIAPMDYVVFARRSPEGRDAVKPIVSRQHKPSADFRPRP